VIPKCLDFFFPDIHFFAIIPFLQLLWAGLADARKITTGDSIPVASGKFYQATEK